MKPIDPKLKRLERLFLAATAKRASEKALERALKSLPPKKALALIQRVITAEHAADFYKDKASSLAALLGPELRGPVTIKDKSFGDWFSMQVEQQIKDSNPDKCPAR